MQYNWFAQVNDELSMLGIDRHKCGTKVIAMIRDCWLENKRPEETAQFIRETYFPELAV